jgi:hypothetical protein
MIVPLKPYSGFAPCRSAREGIKVSLNILFGQLPLLGSFPDIQSGSRFERRSRSRVPSSSGTENSAKAFSFLNGRSDFLTLAVVPALLATPSAALDDLASSASVAARPTHGDDVLEDHGGSILCPRVGHSATS